MSQEQRNNLRRSMEEAVVLPPDDPRRAAVLREVESAGGWARTYWAELVRDQEQVRLALRDVPPPEGLAEALKPIPDQAQATHGRRWRRRSQAAVVLAAACLAVAAVLFVSMRGQTPEFEQAARHVVQLALDDHLEQPELSVTADEPAQVAAHLQPRVSFAVDVPPMDPALSLVGGRICTFEDRPIAYTRWRQDGAERPGGSEAKTFSLYQFCAADFDLPERFMPVQYAVPAVPGQPQAHTVLVWSAGECAYVMVCDGAAPTLNEPVQTLSRAH